MHPTEILSFLLASIAITVAGPPECNFGPQYWCESTANAIKCDVLEFCETKWQEDGIQAAPVKVTVYFESLCPDSRKFVLEQLYPTYMKLKSSGILQVDMVPYGKAHQKQVSGKWMFTCQHGPTECYGNLIETCAIHYMKTASLFIPFINCLFNYEPNDSTGQYCAEKVGYNYGNVKQCVHGSEGNELQHEMGLKTEALMPKATFIPWMTLNGIHSDDIQQGLISNMLSYVCRAYTGPKPAACFM